MKKITLNNIISEQCKDEEFFAHYKRELLINVLARKLVKLSNALDGEIKPQLLQLRRQSYLL